MTSSPSIYTRGLNPEQARAVLHGEGPLLILAGAGSGKTKTMTHRVGYLINERKVPGSQIIALSFTNKAARELKERVQALMVKQASASNPHSRGLTVSTFHSLCARLLREIAPRLGLDRHFSILDQSDARDLLKDLLKHCKIDDRKFDLDAMLSEFSHAKSRGIRAEQPDQVETYFLSRKNLPTDYQIMAANLYSKYQAQLRAVHSLDFDDLLGETVHALETHEDLRKQFAARFKYLLVDEFQDTNPVQFKLLRLLSDHHPNPNLCVVGDDDQSIYSWRGADSSLILSFKTHFPKAEVITLAQNYRSSQNILDAANELIKNNRHRHPKQLWSTHPTRAAIKEYIVDGDREEAKLVADEISRLTQADPETGRREIRWGEIAILYRSNAQSRLFEEALRFERISYKIVGGMSFLERKEVRNVLALFKAVLNPKDDASIRRILNWPSRGIGKTSQSIVGDLTFKAQKPFCDWIRESPTEPTLKKVWGTLNEFASLILQSRSELEALPPSKEALIQWAGKLFDRFEVKRGVDEDCEDAAQFARKWDNAQELLHALGQYNEPMESAISFFRDYLEKLSLRDDETEEEKDEENQQKVTLLTLHGAKGLEFRIVFLVGLEDGFLPHQRTLDFGEDLAEERRLAYVGITRAKEQLIITRAAHRTRYGKKVPRNPSRFLAELPSTLIETEKRVGENAEPPNSGPPPDLSARLGSIKALLQASKRGV